MAEVVQFYKKSERIDEIGKRANKAIQKMDIKELNGMDTAKELTELVKCVIEAGRENMKHPSNLEWAQYAELCKTHAPDDPVFDPYVESFKKKVEEELRAEGYDGPFDWEDD